MIDFIALVKDSERYFFHFDGSEESHDALLQTLGRFAADRDLSLTWYDAARLSQKARRLREERELVR